MHIRILTSMFHDGFDDHTAATLRTVITKTDRIVCIASDFHAPELTDRFWRGFLGMFKAIGLTFREALVVDARMTADEAREAVRGADVVWLSGGDTPTEIRYLREYGLIDVLRAHDGVVIGMSAGALNMGRTVICPVCNGYEKQLVYEGLGLTDITVLCHYDMGEIPEELLELSEQHDICLMRDGSHILCRDERIEYYGDIVRLSKGKKTTISAFAREANPPFVYKRATLDDLALLTETRIEVLRAANRLAPDVDLTEVERESRRYYEEALADGSHTAYLVFAGGEFVAAGGISYYAVMPTYHNPTGRKAYIMNMYTRPACRRRGIAARVLALLVADAKARGIAAISLEATEAGRPLYEKCGFVPMRSEMELP